MSFRWCTWYSNIADRLCIGLGLPITLVCRARAISVHHHPNLDTHTAILVCRTNAISTQYYPLQPFDTIPGTPAAGVVNITGYGNPIKLP